MERRGDARRPPVGRATIETARAGILSNLQGKKKEYEEIQKKRIEACLSANNTLVDTEGYTKVQRKRLDKEIFMLHGRDVRHVATAERLRAKLEARKAEAERKAEA